MNTIFTCIVTASLIILLIVSPENITAVISEGSTKSLSLSVTLMAIYPFWLGLFELMQSSGLTDRLAKILKKPLTFLFGKTDEISSKYITLNVSANLLGLGGIATPMGIEAATSLDKNNNYFAQVMLFVLAATSLQILPMSVFSLRQEAGSVAPFDIFLPSLLSTLVSTVCGILLVKVFVKK